MPLSEVLTIHGSIYIVNNRFIVKKTGSNSSLTMFGCSPTWKRCLQLLVPIHWWTGEVAEMTSVQCQILPQQGVMSSMCRDNWSLLGYTMLLEQAESYISCCTM